MLSTIVFRGLKWGGRRIGDLIAIAVCVVIGGIAYQLWLYPHFWIAAGLSGFLILFWFTQNMGTPPEAPPSEPEIQTVSNNFGSASYASKQTSLDNPDGLTKGVFFGRSSHPDQLMGQGAPIFSKPESHTLIVARTGTGKGTRIIIPTLLRAMKTSAFVIDPDGENGAITARARALHNNVLIMDPWRQLNDTYERLGFPPATFNPLDMVDRKDPNCVAIALALGNSMSPSEGEREPFWARSAGHIIAAVILWLTDQPGEEKTLARLSEILNRSRKSFTMEFVTKMAASKAFEGAIKKLASPFLDMPDTTYGGVMGHIAEATAFLADPRILVATKISSFSMADLTGAGKDRPTTIYLVVPLDRIAVQKTWLRLMITSALSIFKHKPPGARYRCMFLIDEFPALGKVDDMSTNIATLRKSGVDCTLVVQGLSKLKELYGNLADDIVGNCSYKWFCNVNDLQSAEYLSKTLGQKTIRTTTTGENKNTSRNPGGQSQSEGENKGYAEAARWLLTPDEVINLGSDAAILLAPNSRPHYLRPIDYWDLQEAFSEFQKQYPHLYWPLYYDRNAALDPSVPQYPPHPPPAPGTITPPSASGASAYDPTLYARNPDAQQSQGPNKPAGKPIDLTLYAPKPNAQQPQEPKKPAGKPIDLTLYAPKPKGKPEGKDGS